MDEPNPTSHYEPEVYLLRVWYERDGRTPMWRASLKLPHREHKRHFTTPTALLSYLNEHLGHQAAAAKES